MFFQELLKICHVAFEKQGFLKSKNAKKNSHNKTKLLQSEACYHCFTDEEQPLHLLS